MNALVLVLFSTVCQGAQLSLAQAGEQEGDHIGQAITTLHPMVQPKQMKTLPAKHTYC